MNDALELLIVSERTAHLKVVSETAGRDRIHLNTTSPLQHHELGFAGRKPLYILEQPFAPDDGWVIRPTGDGELLSEAGQGESAEIRGLRGWFGDESFAAMSLIESLPVGEYRLLKSPLEPRESSTLLLGNHRIIRPESMRALFDGDDLVHASIVGLKFESPPDCRQPLLGVVISHPTGVSWHGKSSMSYQQLVLFFQVAASTERAGASSNRLLIVPVEGELLLDNLQLYTRNTTRYEPTEIDRGFVDEWRDQFLPAFVRACTEE